MALEHWWICRWFHEPELRIDTGELTIGSPVRVQVRQGLRRNALLKRQIVAPECRREYRLSGGVAEPTNRPGVLHRSIWSQEGPASRYGPDRPIRTDFEISPPPDQLPSSDPDSDWPQTIQPVHLRTQLQEGPVYTARYPVQVR
ncbi:MAG: hypothetical protein ACLFVU_00220 [Phycisphaerae bacterium]